MKVELIRHTENAEELIAAAARVCYTSDKVSDMVTKIDQETVNKMIKVAMDNHHDSILEHISFTFLIEDVSRALTHQLVRHRLCTFHQRSQRYVEVDDLMNDCVIPESIRDNIEARMSFEYAIHVIADTYKYLIEHFGIPKEDARYLLPNATHSQMIMTTNARNLIHIFGLRCCNRSQSEIHKMADLMLEECRKVLPSIFNRVGPNCYINRGFCPEGKMGCGKRKEVIASYKPERTESSV